MNRKLITFRRIVHTGTVNFIRNTSLAIAAMAVMVVTLTIVLFSLITNASFKHTIDQITDKISISAFVLDAVDEKQVQALVDDLKKQPYVARVEYLNKEQATKRFIADNSDNTALSTAIAQANAETIPRTIIVHPKTLQDVQSIRSNLTKPENQKLQTEKSPSYRADRKEAIDNITHATDVLRKIGVATVAIFAIICALIIFNTIQMAIFNRRDEITIMRLLGASTNYIRGPFIVESAIYGVLSAVVSVLIMNSAFLATSNTLQASSLGLLDINYASQYFNEHFLQFLTLQIIIGILIGTVSSVIATRRYLKFKTK